jgi:hypothetical protein
MLSAKGNKKRALIFNRQMEELTGVDYTCGQKPLRTDHFYSARVDDYDPTAVILESRAEDKTADVSVAVRKRTPLEIDVPLKLGAVSHWHGTDIALGKTIERAPDTSYLAQVSGKPGRKVKVRTWKVTLSLSPPPKDSDTAVGVELVGFDGAVIGYISSEGKPLRPIDHVEEMIKTATSEYGINDERCDSRYQYSHLSELRANGEYMLNLGVDPKYVATVRVLLRPAKHVVFEKIPLEPVSGNQ